MCVCGEGVRAEGLGFYFFGGSSDWRMLSPTNLTGVDASVDVACAEHAVIQRISVDMGGFTFVLGDEEDASVHQLVRPVML